MITRDFLLYKPFLQQKKNNKTSIKKQIIPFSFWILDKSLISYYYTTSSKPSQKKHLKINNFQKKYIFFKKSLAFIFFIVYKQSHSADLAQLVEQLICNHQVVCSSQTIGTILKNPPFGVVFFIW